MSEEERTRIYTADQPKGRSNIVLTLPVASLKDILHTNLDTFAVFIEGPDGERYRIMTIDIIDNHTVLISCDESKL